MVDSTIPNLVAVVTPAGTDLFGVRQSGDARDKKLTATQLLSLAPAGGDVFKVGTPVDDQLPVWTGDGTIEGSTNFNVVGTLFRSALGNGPGIVNLNGVNILPRHGDPNTGLQNVGDDRLALVAGGVAGITLIEASGAVLQTHNTNVGITAFATGGQTSATQLNATYNIVDTVATTGDSVKFSSLVNVGSIVYLKNNGANALDLFPAGGDDLGLGVGVALSVPAGASVAFLGSVLSSTWTQLMFAEVAGGGDVTKVGTPADNQLGVWTGDGTIEGTTALEFNGSTFTMNLGGGDFRLTGKVELQGANRPAMQDESASNTNPTLLPLGNSPLTGIGGQGSSMAMIAQSKGAIVVTSLNSQILQAYQTNRTVTAFAGGGQGSAVILGSSYNILTTVATTGDSVKLPILFLGNDPCTIIFIKNDGANAADVFPGSGDDLGAGVDTAVSLPAGESVSYIATVGSSTWTPWIVAPSGGGDVTKVGTPANNQLANWTGDGTLEGDANFLLTGTQLILPAGTSAGLPELKIGSGQTGFFSGSATQLRVTINGTERFTFTSDTIQGFLAGSARMVNRVSSATVPTFVPNTNDDNTGIGSPGGDVLSLIAGGVEVARGITASGTVQLAVPDGSAGKPTYGFVTDPDTGFFLANVATIEVATAGVSHFEFINTAFGAKIAGGARIVDELPSATNPSFVPNKSDTDTGIGWTSADVLSLIAGAIEGLTIAESGGVITMTFRGDLQAAGGGGAGPMMRNVSASPSVPTLIPNQADPDTGLTRSGIDEVALVGGGLDVIRCGEVGGVETIGFYTTAAIAKQTGVAVSSAGIHAALVALGLIAA